MARVLIVYHRQPGGKYWRSTYTSHLTSFQRFTQHDCFYLNTAWLEVPEYLKTLEPDAVIFHYTFLAVRLFDPLWGLSNDRVAFVRDLRCPKAIVPHDEQTRSDRLCWLAREYGVTHVFTPASPLAWPMIYEGLDFDAVSFMTVLTGYVDEETVTQTAERARPQHERSIDIGYRAWASWPFFGRHGLLKVELGDRVAERAPDMGLVVDISRYAKDALLGDSWFDFLLKCKYTLGVEGGSSVFDRDGSIMASTHEYLRRHPGASFEEVEAACFPGQDGLFDYRLLGPRHFEAVLTKTCQVLVEGEYGGALKAGLHYVPVKRDLSDIDEVLAVVKADTERDAMVERAYQDIIASGKWTYEAFANQVLDTTLEAVDWVRSARPAPGGLLDRNRRDTNPARELRVFRFKLLSNPRKYRPLIAPGWAPRTLRELLRDATVWVLGEERLWRMLVGGRNTLRRVRGNPPLDVGDYVPSDAEAARRNAKEARTR
jgi:hypothetical protein